MAKAVDAMSGETTRHDNDDGGFTEIPSLSSTELATSENSTWLMVPLGVAAESSSGADADRSARRAQLIQQRRNCRSEEEFDTARTRPTWTEVASCSTSSSANGPISPVDLELLRAANQHHFQCLVAEDAPAWLTVERSRELRDSESMSNLVIFSPFLWDFEGRMEVGRKLGGGGQAEIYEAVFDGHVDTEYVLKVFRSDTSLADLQRQWISEAGRIQKERWKVTCYRGVCHVLCGTILQDGRFVFVMERYWGDLRKLIDLQIVKVMENIHQSPPFPLSIAIWIMLKIASGMIELHNRGVLHRDLKAANVLLSNGIEDYIRTEKIYFGRVKCDVADFESSQGVIGTGFWRAPEILHALKNKVKDVFLDPNTWTEKVDVYSYAMTSYEVLTGCIPFQNRAANDYDGVIGGERPSLPDHVDPEIQELIGRCWHSEPLMRPTFTEISDELKAFIDKKSKYFMSLLEDKRDAEAMRWLQLSDFVCRRYKWNDNFLEYMMK